MAEVDTSSYPKPTDPKPLLDQVQQLGSIQQQKQSIESGALTIDKQKLDLINQRFGEMAKGFTQLINKPDLKEDDVRNYVTNQVKLGYVPAEMAAQTINSLPPTQGMSPQQASAALKQSLEQHLQHAQTTMEAINYHAGTPAEAGDNQNIYQGVRQSASKGGGFVPATVTPQQLPPNQPIVGAGNVPGVIGPAGPSGPRPYAQPGGGTIPTPAARPAPAGLRSAVAPPVAAPAVSGPNGPTVNQGTEFNNRFSAAFPNAVATGVAPGVAEAQQAVGTKSGTDLATDLTKAKNYKQDLYPAERALEIVHELGPQGFGPGTEGLNTVKSAIATWLPNVDQKTIDSVSNFEQARKYLTQIARSSGATGTNDQLAAAFEANPSVKMNSASIENVLKSVIALRKMQHAQTLLAVSNGVPADQYSQWIAKNQNVLDPRAFGFDIMDGKAKEKLLTGMAKKDNAGNWVALKGKEKEFQKFESSLQFANDANLIAPPGRQ
jgi:hypothetical protein